MRKRGKKYIEKRNKIDGAEKYDIKDAFELAIGSSYIKFDETIDIAVKLGVDPRHADQMVRGTVVLPNGLGKEVKVLVFAKGEKEKEASDAGADFVGNDDLIQKIKDGWLDFDKAVATPDVMASVGKIGRMLGPRGLMPNAKTGTVTFDIDRTVKELKAGKIDFRVEKAGIIHTSLGKCSFGVDKLLVNFSVFIEKIIRLRPASSKGIYIKSLVVSSTMGPGVKIDTNLIKDFIKN